MAQVGPCSLGTVLAANPWGFFQLIALFPEWENKTSRSASWPDDCPEDSPELPTQAKGSCPLWAQYWMETPSAKVLTGLKATENRLLQTRTRTGQP